MSLNAPDFDAFQRNVAALWASSPIRRGVDNPAQEAAAKLAEEAGEAIKEMNSLAPAAGPMETWADGWERLEAELGDLLFVTARVANIYGISLSRAALVALDKFADRYAGKGQEDVIAEFDHWRRQLRIPVDAETARALAAYQAACRPTPSCDVCRLPVTRATDPAGPMKYLPGPGKPAISGHEECVRPVMNRMEEEWRRRQAEPYPTCPGGVVECYFIQDKAAAPGSRCERCGHVKEGAR